MTRVLRKSAFSAVLLFLVMAVIELQAFGFAAISIWQGNGYGFYPSNIFRLSRSELRQENVASPVGWPDHDNPRPAVANNLPECASSFGDSFTFGDEVDDTETLQRFLSDEIGCKVLNFGYGGYGLDQAVLRFERIRPPQKLVIIGINTVMLRRDLAASWTFYAGNVKRNQPTYQITKPLFLLKDGDLQLVPRPSPPITNGSVAAHHVYDHYQPYWTPLSFPFTFAVAKAVHRTLVERKGPQHEGPIWEPNQPRQPRELALKLLQRMAAGTKLQGQQFAVVFIPDPIELGKPLPSADFQSELTASLPEACVFDPHLELESHARLHSGNPLTAPLGHYTPVGNRIIAQVIAANLHRCGMMPT